MIDNKDRAALATLLVWLALVCGASLALSVVLGISIHILRALGGI